MSFEEFEDGHHGISELNDFSKSESLCHCDASHQVSAQSDLWFGRRCCLKNFKMAAMAKISRWPQWRPSWISERYNFSNFESLSHCDASFGEFQDGGHLGYLNQTILAILNLCVSVMPPIKFLPWCVVRHLSIIRPSSIHPSLTFHVFDIS